MTHTENNEQQQSSVDQDYDALKQQNSAMRELLDRTHSENNRYKQRLEQLAHALQERDKRIAELQLFEYRLKKTNEKTQDLETQVAGSKDAIQSIQEEKSNLQNALTDSQQHAKQLERVIQFLRERAETGRLELRQIQTELVTTQKASNLISQKSEEKSAETAFLEYAVQFEKNKHEETLSELRAIQQQWGQLQKSVRNAQQQATQTNLLINSLRNEKQYLETALLAKEDAFAPVKNELSILQKKYHALQQSYKTAVDINLSATLRSIQLKQEIQSQEAEIEELYTQRQSLRQEISALKDALRHNEACLNDVKSINADREAEIRLAQQYLAKRVKEATLLSEKNDLLSQQLAEMRKETTSHQSKAMDLQLTLEKQLQNERQLQEQFSESLKLTETKVGHWESKYLQAYEKWQETEAKNNALRALEEKQNQMQALLLNLSALSGSVSSTPSYGAHPQPIVTSISIEKHSVQDIITQKEATHAKQAPEMNAEQEQLFETAKPSVRYKKSLFD